MKARNKRRLAWLSPYGPRSDIGAFTRNLLPHLARPMDDTEFDVHLWVNTNGDTYPSPVPAIPLEQQPALRHLLGLYDFAVFNVGNNGENHHHIFQALRHTAGVVVLHDFVYQHFLAHECFERHRSPAAYARLVGELYGSAGLQPLLHSRICDPDGRLYAPWEGGEAARWPMFELITGLASAVVVHSEFAARQVRQKFRGPVLQLQLPHDQKPAPDDAAIAQWASLTAHRAVPQFACFGHINRTKLLDKVLLAFAASPRLRGGARLVFAGYPGDAAYVEELRALATGLGLGGQFSLELAVPQERLQQIKAETDVFINLRHPNTEGGSASLIEQLDTGRPVVVHDSGCYADLPTGAALKWHLAQGLPVLTAQLEGIAADPGERVRMGAVGREYARRLDGAGYARALQDFLLEQQGRLRRVQMGVAGELQPGSKPQPAADDVAATRLAWDLLESDPLGYAPRPFLHWPPDAAAAFAAALVHPRRGSGFTGLVQQRAVDDPVALHEDVCRLHSALRLGHAWHLREHARQLARRAAATGAAEPAAAPPPSPELLALEAQVQALACLKPRFWKLVLHCGNENIARVMHVCLGAGAWGERIGAWVELMALVSPRLALWVFLRAAAPEAAGAPADRQALADWALGDPAHLPLAERAERYLRARGGATRPPQGKAGAGVDVGEFDEADYLRRHPDVAEAVARGEFGTGWDHFRTSGQAEGRGFRIHLNPELRAL